MTRIQELIKFLLVLPKEKFNLHYYGIGGDELPTECCAVGWFPAIWPTEFFWHKLGKEFTIRNRLNRICPTSLIVMEWLNITKDQYLDCFCRFTDYRDVESVINKLERL